MGNLVVKSNSLIDSSFDLGLTEQRIVLLAILQARSLDITIEAGTRLRVNAHEYAEIYNTNLNNAHMILKKVSKSLLNRQFVWYDKDAKGLERKNISQFVDTISYIDGANAVEVVFGLSMTPHILNLTSHFTSYEIGQTSNLNTYGLRLYEMLIKYKRHDKKMQISLDELREKLKIPADKYLRPFDFRSKVVNTAVKEINDNTDITVKVKNIKQLRSIAGFEFQYTMKKSKDVSEEVEPEPVSAPTIENQVAPEVQNAEPTPVEEHAPCTTDDYWTQLEKELGICTPSEPTILHELEPMIVEPVTELAPEPEKDPLIAPPPKRKINVERPNTISEQTWEDFLAMKRQQKMPMNKSAWDVMFTDICLASEQSGMTHDAIVKRWIARGWRFFEPSFIKNTNQPYSSQPRGQYHDNQPSAPDLSRSRSSTAYVANLANARAVRQGYTTNPTERTVN